MVEKGEITEVIKELEAITEKLEQIKQMVEDYDYKVLKEITSLLKEASQEYPYGLSGLMKLVHTIYKSDDLIEIVLKIHDIEYKYYVYQSNMNLKAFYDEMVKIVMDPKVWHKLLKHFESIIDKIHSTILGEIEQLKMEIEKIKSEVSKLKEEQNNELTESSEEDC